MPTTNWAGNVTFRAASCHAPSSMDELRALVAGNPRVRALGTGHSFNRIADTTGAQVSLAGMPRTIDIDSQVRRVTVGPGVRYGELTPRLHDAGLALRNLGSLPHISVAGACATGTHGSGVRNGTLASSVTAVQLLTASGDVVRASRSDDPDGFTGMIIALGCLGIVTRLTLDVVPKYDIAQYVYEGLSDVDLDQHIDGILADGYSVSVFTDLYENRVWRKCSADQPVEPVWFGARLATVARNPVPGMPADNCTVQLGVPGPWYERLPHFRLEFTPSSGNELQSEYLLPREHAAAALEALRRVRDRIGPVLQIAEIRTVAADELWLSPSYRRDTVAFHFTWVHDWSAVRPVLAAVEQQLAPFDPRPHWGKAFLLDTATVRAQYQRLPDFQRLRDELDPDRKFGNELVDRYLG